MVPVAFYHTTLVKFLGAGKGNQDTCVQNWQEGFGAKIVEKNMFGKSHEKSVIKTFKMSQGPRAEVCPFCAGIGTSGPKIVGVADTDCTDGTVSHRFIDEPQL